VRLGLTETPVEDVRRALQGTPQVLALDSVDTVTDPVERRRIRYELADALSRARLDGRPFAMVVSCVEPDGLDDLLPESAEPSSVQLTGPAPATPPVHAHRSTEKATV
jgi:RND superfamily putative drug exporter